MKKKKTISRDCEGRKRKALKVFEPLLLPLLLLLFSYFEKGLFFSFFFFLWSNTNSRPTSGKKKIIKKILFQPTPIRDERKLLFLHLLLLEFSSPSRAKEKEEKEEEGKRPLTLFKLMLYYYYCCCFLSKENYVEINVIFKSRNGEKKKLFGRFVSCWQHSTGQEENTIWSFFDCVFTRDTRRRWRPLRRFSSSFSFFFFFFTGAGRYKKSSRSFIIFPNPPLLLQLSTWRGPPTTTKKKGNLSPPADFLSYKNLQTSLSETSNSSLKQQFSSQKKTRRGCTSLLSLHSDSWRFKKMVCCCCCSCCHRTSKNVMNISS